MAPWLSTFPVLPPSTRMPVELLTSVLLIVPPATTVTLLLLFRMTPSPFAFGVTVQPDVDADVGTAGGGSRRGARGLGHAG